MVTKLTPAKISGAKEIDLWIADKAKKMVLYRFACYKSNGKWMAELCIDFQNILYRDLTPTALCNLLNKNADAAFRKGNSVKFDIWSKSDGKEGLLRIKPGMIKPKRSSSRVPRARKCRRC